jgi:hypothetical protein
VELLAGGDRHDACRGQIRHPENEHSGFVGDDVELAIQGDADPGLTHRAADAQFALGNFSAQYSDVSWCGDGCLAQQKDYKKSWNSHQLLPGWALKQSAADALPCKSVVSHLRSSESLLPRFVNSNEPVGKLK